MFSDHDIYDPLKSNVGKLTQKNWKNNLEKGIQNDQIFVVHFHNHDDGQSYDFTKELEEKSEKLKGIINFAFVNCEKDRALCKKNAPKDLPALKLYPPVPIPA